MKRSKIKDGLGKYVDKEDGYCPYCGDWFEYEGPIARFCQDTCRWKFNSAKKRDPFYAYLVDLNIPLERNWCLKAKETLGQFFKLHPDSLKELKQTQVEFDILYDIALLKLNYPPLLQQDDQTKIDALIALLESRKMVSFRMRAKEKIKKLRKRALMEDL